MLRKTSIRLLAVVIALAPCAATRATQNELVPPTSGIFTGVQYSQKLGDAFRSVASGNSGAGAPANVGGAAVDGLPWIDTTTSMWLKKRYVSGGWATEGAYDSANSAWVGIIGGGAPASIAGASTTDLGSLPQANVSITGTTTIASFGSSAASGIVKIIRFAAALTLTNSAALAVPGGFDLTTAAGDRAIVTHLGSGNWEITQFTRASGIPVDVAAVGKMEFGMFESVPPLHVAAYGQALSRTTYPAYFAKVTRTQNATRVSGNATLTGLSNLTGFGAGMHVEGTGIAAGCTIAGGSGNIVLNSSSCVTSSGTGPITVFLTGYGRSGDGTTVGVPECRGSTLAGRDRGDPGSFLNLLTTSYFGADSSVFNSTGGHESQTLLATQLPSITSTNPAQAITVNPLGNNALFIPYTSGSITEIIGSLNNGSAPFPAHNPGSTWVGTATFSGNNSISVTSTGTSGNPHPIVQPTLIAECVVRVTP